MPTSIMPSHDSPSPSPLKRPGLNQRTSSTNSLSSSQKHTHKVHRAGHAVHHRAQHGRNPSYGKNLNKLTRLLSTPNITADGRNHARKKSGPTTLEPASPHANVKRNASHVSLPKTTSHTSLKKNHSTTSLPRNTSAPLVKKPGLAPPTQAAPNKKENTVGGFSLGDNSDEESEAEWEDSSHSPNTTRQNSTSEGLKKGQGVSANNDRKQDLPPAASLKEHHKSAPSSHRKEQRESNVYPPVEDVPSLLAQNGRSARAPPAMSSVAAVARPSSTANLSRDLKKAQNGVNDYGAASSVENGVSQFVNGSVGAHGTPRTPDVASDDDYDSPSSFLPHYHPQEPARSEPSHSRSSSGLLNRRSNGSSVLPSRTQQRLELQRRETMRAASTPSEIDTTDIPLALRARSASRGRGKPGQDNTKAARRDYETANSYFDVIKRYRNPLVEALTRLRDSGIIPEKDSNGNGFKSRPLSRAGSKKSIASKHEVATKGNHAAPAGTQTANDGNHHQRLPSRGRVRFERQGSHDDIGLSRSHGEEDFDDDAELGSEGDSAVNAEEALLRRMWESREVYEAS